MSEPGAAGTRRGSFAALPADEPYPGVVRRAFDGERTTTTRYVFAPGAEFPRHRHPQEQTLIVEEGHVTFTVAGEPLVMEAGDWAVVAPDVEHGVRAGEAGAQFLAVIAPRRAGANAYTIVS